MRASPISGHHSEAAALAEMKLLDYRSMRAAGPRLEYLTRHARMPEGDRMHISIFGEQSDGSCGCPLQ
jgi:hypothetical protein